MGKDKITEARPIDIGFIDGLNKTYIFHLTGGEPFLVPNFIEICQHLEDNGQYLSINTNLTRSVDTFIKTINPNSVVFLNCSIHYLLRKKHIKPFLKHYNDLRRAGFYLFATIVMIPELFDEIESFWNEYAAEIAIFPKMMRGISNNKSYPQEYTERQKQSIREMVQVTSKKLESKDKARYDVLCSKSVSLDNWKTGLAPSGNEICVDGSRLVRITETGDILYCRDSRIGNVYQAGLKTMSKAPLCEYRTVDENYKYICNR
jgi:organic radical activating enzyme